MKNLNYDTASKNLNYEIGFGKNRDTASTPRAGLRVPTHCEQLCEKLAGRQAGWQAGFFKHGNTLESTH